MRIYSDAGHPSGLRAVRMGYGSPILEQVADLLAGNANIERMSVLDIGAQEINREVLPSKLLRFVYRLNPNFDKPEELLRMLPGCFAAQLFRAAKVSYRCIDLFEAEAVVPLDLNTNTLPSEHRGRYDLVTNVGTTEHIFNQANAFEAIHDATKVGGFMLHEVPGNGLFNHGLIKYEPRFFLLMAHVNNYEIVSWEIVLGGSDYMPVSDDIPGSRGWSERDISQFLLRFVLKKRADNRFIQPSDVDLRYLPADLPISMRNAMTSSNALKQVIIPADRSPGELSSIHQQRSAAIVASNSTPNLVRTLERIEWRCQEAGLGVEPYALAAAMIADRDFDLSKIESGWFLSGRQQLDDLVVKAADKLSAPPQRRCLSVDLGLSFLGTGWGEAGADIFAGRPRRFRALGPGGTARLYFRLPCGHDYRLDTLVFDALPGDAMYRLRVSPAERGEVDIVAGEYWHRSRLAKEAVSRNSGLVKLEFEAEIGDRINVQRVECTQI